MAREKVALAKIRIDGGTQPRVKIDTDIVDEYADLIEAGVDIPLIEIFFDGAALWLADGFHRYHGYRKLDRKTIECNVRKGTVRDAILFSCGANATHGLRRSNADKRHAVETLLADPEWAKNSNRWIAETACVGDKLVAEVRAQLRDPAVENSRTGKDGKSRPVEQRRIGGRTAPVSRDSGATVITIEKDTPENRVARRNNGKPLVTDKDRQLAIKAAGAILRFADKAKVHGAIRPHIDAITEIIKRTAG